MSQAQQTQTTGMMKPSSRVYWMRFLLGVVAGFVNHLLGITDVNYGELALPLGIGLAVIFYLLSVFIVKYVFRFGEVELKGKNRYITLGGGTFIMVWVMVAVLLYTLKL